MDLAFTAEERKFADDVRAFVKANLPAEVRDKARRLGLGFAMATRLLLLFSLSWVMGLTADLFHLAGNGISGRDLVLLLGGLFLLWKASHEIFVEVEAREQDGPPAEAVIPGGADDTAAARGITRDEVINDVLLAAQPSKRFATVEELGELALFLSSPAAASITGTAISMDGGWTAQ